jgi:hypothetical protein
MAIERMIAAFMRGEQSQRIAMRIQCLNDECGRHSAYNRR